MVIYERIKDTDLILAYSNNNMKIRSDETGAIYEEAIDPDFCNRTYTETDEPIDDILTSEQIVETIFGNGEISEQSEEEE